MELEFLDFTELSIKIWCAPELYLRILNVWFLKDDCCFCLLSMFSCLLSLNEIFLATMGFKISLIFKCHTFNEKVEIKDNGFGCSKVVFLEISNASGRSRISSSWFFSGSTIF